MKTGGGKYISLSNILMYLFLVVMVLLSIFPLYRMFAQVHLLNTTAAFVLPSVSTAFLSFFFRQSAHTFPLELVQAARVDGLGEFSIYLRIFFPVMAPTFAAAAIVNFMGHWNDYMWPLVIQQTQASQTLAILTANLVDPYDTDYGELMLAITIYTVPMLIIFITQQRRFVAGVLGSIK
jgi:lactose/L-arabinose transport system permease protein